jgi:hypothetical protein
MEDLTTTLSGNEDVVDTEINNDEQVETEVEQQVDSNEETNTEDYDKAWESIDTDNPSEGLFGETTVDDQKPVDTEDQSIEQVDEVQQVDTNGLMIKNPVLKYKGREIPIDSEEELINLAQKGFKLNTEMQKIKPYKSYVSIIDNGNIKIEDLKAFDDAMSGNEQAKDYLSKKLGLSTKDSGSNGFFDDVDDTPSEGQVDYKPEVPTQDPVSDYFASITEENPEVAGKISTVYTDLDDEFKTEIYNPQVFPMFASSVANGEFDRLYPLAIKEKLSNPGLTWLQAYQMAGSKQGKVEDKAVVPSNATKIPKRNSSKPRTATDSYDRAFDMDTQELEAKLFG